MPSPLSPYRSLFAPLRSSKSGSTARTENTASKARRPSCDAPFENHVQEKAERRPNGNAQQIRKYVRRLAMTPDVGLDDLYDTPIKRGSEYHPKKPFWIKSRTRHSQDREGQNMMGLIGSWDTGGGA